MRTLPTTYNYTALYQNGIIAHYASVLVYNAAQSSSNDLTNYDGVDLVRQVTLNDNIDDPGITVKLSLQRDVYKKSLSPQNAYSKWNQGAPLVFVGLRVAIFFASVPVDVSPSSSDFLQVADQHIDQMEFSKDSVELTCSDRIIALLRNTYIDTQRTYGTTLVAIESVMQGILDDNINTPLGYTVGNGKKITMQLPGGSPGFTLAVGPVIQKQSVLDALNTLAGNIGWSLRCKWVSGLSAFALCFYAPSRSVATPLFTFPPTVLMDISQAQISKTDIRNFIYGYFTDSTNNNVRQYAVAQDATSIAKYGDPPMKMEMSEAATSQINTPTQMSNLLSSALSDLKDAVCQYQVTVPLFIGAEISDAYKLQADMVIFDSDQSVGLTQLAHTIGKNACNSQMTLNGSLPGQYNRWFQGEARPGVSPASNNLDPAGPTVSLGANVGQIVVNYTVADQANWQTTEVYISGSTFSQPAKLNSKNVRPTAATLAAKGKQGHFTINALTPGTTYYIAVIVIDRDGNIGTMSAVQSVSTQTVGPYHENLNGQQDQLIRNPDLNIYTLGSSSPPDSWLLDQGAGMTWASTMADNTLAASGKLCITLPYDGPAGNFTAGSWYTAYLSGLTSLYFSSGATYGYTMYSAAVPIPASEVVSASVSVRSSVAGANSSTGIRAVLFIQACDANGVPVTTSLPTANLLIIPQTTFSTYSIPVQGLPSTARTVRLGIVVCNPTSGATVSIDRFYLNRTNASAFALFKTYDTNDTDSQLFIPANGNTPMPCYAAANGSVGTFVPTGSKTCLKILVTGTYQISGATWGYYPNNVSTTAPTYCTMDIQTSPDGTTWTSAAQGALYVGGLNFAGLQVNATLSLTANTYVRFLAANQNASNTFQFVTANRSFYNCVMIARPDR